MEPPSAAALRRRIDNDNDNDNDNDGDGDGDGDGDFDFKRGISIIKRGFDNLYIHIPFCRAKCAYCAFHSLAEPNPETIEAYLAKITAEIEKRRPRLNGLDTIYIGGGTPTILTPDQLEKLLYALPSANEFSIECNPETLTPAKTDILSGKINRISFGLQSFRRDSRGVLGRSGDPEKIFEAIDLARAVGIENIGVDMIYAIPGQDIDIWREELERVSGLPIKHLSTYALTIEEGSELAAGEMRPLEDSLAADMWLATGEIMKKNGFHRYEISNLAKPGFECRHNLNIWRGGTYLGLGPTASSFDGVDRWTEAPTKRWLQDESPEFDRLDKPARVRELFVMGLRTTDGWTEGQFRTAAGVDWALMISEIENLTAQGLLISDTAGVRPSEKGLLFWDEMAAALI